MKWINKGKELESKTKNILEEFKKKNGIYIFGAGTYGEDIRIVLERYNLFAGYIDNDEMKQKAGYHGAKVLSFRDFIDMAEEKWIVIAASEKNAMKISVQLEREGYREKKDYFIHNYFMREIFPIISLYCYNMLYVDLVQISLTERCTLKCKKCAHACFNVSDAAEDLSLDLVKESVDCFFSRYDIAKEFVLIGGEPFLYREIKAVVEYIGRNYRDRIITFSITTNGTIIPDNEMVELCMKYDVTLRISDYSDSIPKLKNQYGRLYERLKRNKIVIWKTNKENAWFDYGFGEYDRGDIGAELISVFDRCGTPCREIRGSRFYYCVMARSVADNLGMDIGKQDYIDLKEIEDRNVLMEFQMGFSDKGYLDMCRYCRGAEAKKHLIPAAEQKGK